MPNNVPNKQTCFKRDSVGWVWMHYKSTSLKINNKKTILAQFLYAGGDVGMSVLTAWGARGSEFESRRPDQKKQALRSLFGVA